VGDLDPATHLTARVMFDAVRQRLTSTMAIANSSRLLAKSGGQGASNLVRLSLSNVTNGQRE
jgi:hypothetical protein